MLRSLEHKHTPITQRTIATTIFSYSCTLTCRSAHKSGGIINVMQLFPIRTADINCRNGSHLEEFHVQTEVDEQ